MRAVRISARRTGKSRMALLGIRTALYSAILEDFVAPKHPSYFQPENQILTTHYIIFLCKFVTFLSKLHLLGAQE